METLSVWASSIDSLAWWIHGIQRRVAKANNVGGMHYWCKYMAGWRTLFFMEHVFFIWHPPSQHSMCGQSAGNIHINWKTLITAIYPNAKVEVLLWIGVLCPSVWSSVQCFTIIITILYHFLCQTIRGCWALNV